LAKKKGKWTEIVGAIDFDQSYKIYPRPSNLPGSGYAIDPVSDTDDDESKDNDTAELSGPRAYNRLFDWFYEKPRK
jgi:hypothetical protein